VKITVCHSHQEKCGIHEYGMQLDRSLNLFGVEVAACDFGTIERGIDDMEYGGILLVHYEPGLVHSGYLSGHLRRARAKGARILFCCHWYDHDYMREYDGLVDQFVVHRNYAPRHENSTVIPLGCPVYATSESRAELRARLRLPEDATVLTTIGFLTRWKCMPEITAAMLVAIAPHPKLFMHIHTPWPFNTADAHVDEPRIRTLVDDHPRVRFSTRFLPERDTLDIARAADLGFVYHSIHTGSVSAATKQFVSARRPLVITASNHVSDLQGVERVNSFDPDAFARAVVDVARSPERLTTLQTQAEAEYDRLNMHATARQYIALFRSFD